MAPHVSGNCPLQLTAEEPIPPPALAAQVCFACGQISVADFCAAKFLRPPPPLSRWCSPFLMLPWFGSVDSLSPAPADSISQSLCQRRETCRAMDSRAPFFFLLLLLLAVSLGAAEGRNTVFLHIEESRDPGQSYKEQITSSKIPVPVERGSPLCSACENFTNEAVSYLSQKQAQDKMMEILHDACAQTFSLEQKCVELVDSYATLLFAKIAEIKPEEFCKQYDLCRDTALLSGAKSESTCVFCHHLMDEVMSKLKDPDAEFEIIQILLKECNKVEGHVQQCKRLVLQYIPLILVNGEKFLEKNDVCAIVQACDASQMKTFGSFSEEVLLSDA